jgi:hypothetical protein
LDYFFFPGLVDNSDEQQVVAFASQLITNASLAVEALSQHLPSFNIDLASLRSLSVNQTSVSVYSSNPTVHIIRIRLSVTVGIIPSLPTQSDSGDIGRRRALMAVASSSFCSPNSFLTTTLQDGNTSTLNEIMGLLSQGLSPIFVNASLPAATNVTCATPLITMDALLVSRLITLFVNAAEWASGSASLLGRFGSSTLALGDALDAAEDSHLVDASALMKAVSSDQGTVLASLAVSP